MSTTNKSFKMFSTLVQYMLFGTQFQYFIVPFIMIY
jgi:hypothetical protein